MATRKKKKRTTPQKKKKKVSKKVAKPKAAETVFIVNPNAAAGRARNRWPEIENAILRTVDNFKVLHTERPLHATELARAAIKEGTRNIIAVGGDGTISEVTAGFFDARCKPLKKPGKNSPALAVLPAGTGSDLVRSLDIPKDIEMWLSMLGRRNLRTIDAGKVSFRNKQGRNEVRPFINIAEVGLGGAVIEILDRRGKQGGGWLAYQAASLRGLMSYEGAELHVTLDGKIERTGRFKGVVVANGKYFGSGMMVAPNADLSDGLFDVIFLGDMGKLQMALKMSKLRSGKHIYEDGIEITRAHRVEVECLRGRALLDSDGEQPGQCPVEFQVIPSALNVIVP